MQTRGSVVRQRSEKFLPASCLVVVFALAITFAFQDSRESALSEASRFVAADSRTGEIRPDTQVARNGIGCLDEAHRWEWSVSGISSYDAALALGFCWRRFSDGTDRVGRVRGTSWTGRSLTWSVRAPSGLVDEEGSSVRYSRWYPAGSTMYVTFEHRACTGLVLEVCTPWETSRVGARLEREAVTWIS